MFAALYWFNYELVKDELCDRYRVPQASFAVSFTAGAVSGAVSKQTKTSDPLFNHSLHTAVYFIISK